jgi:hypothetical protein
VLNVGLLLAMLSVVILFVVLGVIFYCQIKCHYAEFHYSERHFSIVMLNFVHLTAFLSVMFSLLCCVCSFNCFAACSFAGCHYAEYHNVEYHVFIIMLSVDLSTALLSNMF